MTVFPLLQGIVENVSKGNQQLVYFLTLQTHLISCPMTYYYYFENFGVRDIAIDWLASYLFNRSQAVEIRCFGSNSQIVSNKSLCM